MKRMLCVISVCLISATMLGQAAADKPKAKGDDMAKAAAKMPAANDMKATFQSIEDKWANAMKEGNGAYVDSITANDYAITDENGHVIKKADVVAELNTKPYKFDSVSNDDLTVNQFGNCAIVRAIASQSGTYKGKPLPPKQRYTDTFCKIDGKWKAVATHISNVEGK